MVVADLVRAEDRIASVTEPHADYLSESHDLLSKTTHSACMRFRTSLPQCLNPGQEIVCRDEDDQGEQCEDSDHR